LEKIVLYDGWDLVYRPNSPAAIHLLTLLAAHPAEFGARVALPGESFHPLPPKAHIEISATPDTASARLRWEQRFLPDLARKSSAGLIHLVSGAPALFGGTPSLISPAATSIGSNRLSRERQRSGFLDHLGLAVRAGGMARALALLWPGDLPAPEWTSPIHNLPPVVHPAFKPSADENDEYEDRHVQVGLDAQKIFELPETYVLFHGSTARRDLLRLVDAWSWAGGAIGENYPLVIVGLDQAAERNLAAFLDGNPLGKRIIKLPLLPLDALAGVYRGCCVFFHPSPHPAWGDPLRFAMACGKPVVSLEFASTDALVGPAGYLIPSGGSRAARNRALGAAVITLVVEEEIAEKLELAAQERAAKWDMRNFSQALGEVYRRFLE
jgi:glycosyltransferase involved in cell wall biosynthesis